MQIKAAIIQYQPTKGEKAANLRRLTGLIAQAGEAGAQLAVAPEMCTTGYVFTNPDQVDPLAEEAQGESFEFLAQAAAQAGLYLVYGYPQRQSGRLYNAQNLLDPKGRLLATYQKRHLFDADRSWARPGASPFISCPSELGNLGLGICMDFNYDDLLRFHKEQNTHLLCLSMHWVEEGQDVCTYWRWRLRNYPGLVLISNAYGTDRGTPFCGRSSAYRGPDLMAAMEPSGDGLLIVDLPYPAGGVSPLP